jgi:MFS family permease
MSDAKSVETINQSHLTAKAFYIRPWPATVIALLACLAAAISLFKVQPLIPVLMESLSIGEAKAGFLMAIFSIAGIVLAVPSGLVISRFGVYKTGGAALLCLILGSLATVIGLNYPSMVASRLIEGIGMALLSIIGVVVVALVFPPKRRGAPMGLLCLYVSMGELSTLNLAPTMAQTWGWPSIWWGSLIFGVLVLIVWSMGFRRLESSYQVSEEVSFAGKTELRQVFSNPKVFLLTLAFSLYTVAYIGVFVFWPTFLNAEKGYSLAAAASLVSLISLINIPFSFICGSLSDKLGSRKAIIIGAMLLSAATFFLIPSSVSFRLMASLFIIGICCIAVPVITYAAATELYEDQRLSSVAVSIVTAGQNTGMFVGPMLMGLLVETQGWEFAFKLMAPVTVISAVIIAFCRIK